MPILNDRIVDQLDELLPEYINEEGHGLKKFMSAYFDFLEKGILIHKEGTDPVSYTHLTLPTKP